MGETPSLYFWRDQSGSEIDLIIDNGHEGYPLEFKLSQTFIPDYRKAINSWLNLQENPAQTGAVVYCGEHTIGTKDPVPAVPWYKL